jgi:hypothetical protein
MRLQLYGNTLTLYGHDLTLYPAAVIASAPRGDDAFRTSGAREGFWKAKAEEELQGLLEQAQEAISKPVEARKAVADDFALIEWEALPQAPQIGAVLSALVKPQPDYTALAAMIMAEMERLRIKARRKRDIEALMVLM